MKKYFAIFVLLLFCHTSLGQENVLSHLKLEANINYTNKKRSYAVYSDNKYANSGYFFGLDFGLFYQAKLFDIGIEYFPYQHLNGSIQYTGLKFLRSSNLKLIPDFKLGYSPLLSKIYYGFGATMNIKWFSVGYNKILHVKSGNSQYHGDGLDGFSMGIILKISNKRN